MRPMVTPIIIGLMLASPAWAGDPAGVPVVEAAQLDQLQREGRQTLRHIQHPPAVMPAQTSAQSPARKHLLDNQQRATQMQLHGRQHREMLYENQRARTVLPGNQGQPRSRIPFRYRTQQNGLQNRFRTQQRMLNR